MTNFLSAISGQFSKSLILGAFLPVTVFVVLLYCLLPPLIPDSGDLFAPLAGLDTQWKVLAVTLAILLLSGLLFNLNTSVIRLYEGYPWMASALGKKRVEHYQEVRRLLEWQSTGLTRLSQELEQPQQRTQGDKITSQLGRNGRVLKSDFPVESSILPTRLGNVIRSFENYPRLQYGLSAIPLWPRLTAVIPKDYAVTVDESKTTFDFLINCSLLCGLSALTVFVVGLWYGLPFLLPGVWAGWTCEFLIFVLLSYGFYLGAIEQARAWGDLVKGAFDLYRRDMLKQLGYLSPPTGMAEERALWLKISQQMVYGDPPDGHLPQYQVPPTGAHGEFSLNDYRLKLTRGVDTPDADGVVTVTLKVKNGSRTERLKKVVVTDTLPDGYYFLWGSARKNYQEVTVEGINPYSFLIGDMFIKEDVLISYKMTPLKK